MLAEIEDAAATLFADRGLPASVLEDRTSLEEFVAAQRAGHLWVARDAGGSVVGFALVDLVDGKPHLEEMDVHPAAARCGIGRALVLAVSAWARAAGHAAVTLTTFSQFPWNEPFYASCGFRSLAVHELSLALRLVVEEEATRGLDPATRVVMRLSL